MTATNYPDEPIDPGTDLDEDPDFGDDDPDDAVDASDEE